MWRKKSERNTPLSVLSSPIVSEAAVETLLLIYKSLDSAA
jgi:hypothetical protein